MQIYLLASFLFMEKVPSAYGWNEIHFVVVGKLLIIVTEQ